MSLDNDKNNQDFNEFLQSLQNDDGIDAASASSGKDEAFPFADSFDIDSFVKENGIASGLLDLRAGAGGKNGPHTDI